ncbi:MAG: protein-L-isoaspartate(D-aspartate) O-methyltransferase [Actinobacteria bacterium]|nr:protein-L-isoaspartate(D-aspartate) O-methyltransferase [Actinomycetota bacterium]
MAKSDLRRRGITDAGVLAAMSSVPREQFVPPDVTNFAYDDRPLPIGEGQTISQPYVVALMAQASRVTTTNRVLEIGTGSGYGAAILSRVADVVVSVERHETLANTARKALTAAGYENVTVIHGDGTLGHPEAAPYDAIVVTAGGPKVPKPLIEQLGDGGFLVMPVGPDNQTQSLIRIKRAGSELHEQNLGRVRFVPLIGAEA